MQTDITVTATKAEMSRAFDKINIRFYELYDKSITPRKNIKVKWNVTIRHNEEEDPKAIFYDAALLKKKPITKKDFDDLFQMVVDLKKCVHRLCQDGVSQFERDTEAQWEAEAHELLQRINTNYKACK